MASSFNRLVAAHAMNRPPTTKNVTKFAMVRLFMSRPRQTGRGTARVLGARDGPHVDLGELERDGLGEGVDELVQEVDDRAQLLGLGRRHGEDGVDLLDLPVEVGAVLVE